MKNNQEDTMKINQEDILKNNQEDTLKNTLEDTLKKNQEDTPKNNQENILKNTYEDTLKNQEDTLDFCFNPGFLCCFASFAYFSCCYEQLFLFSRLQRNYYENSHYPTPTVTRKQLNIPNSECTVIFVYCFEQGIQPTFCTQYVISLIEGNVYCRVIKAVADFSLTQCR